MKLYHLADKVDFTLDPEYSPTNNSTLGGEWPEAGVFLTGTPEHWLNGYSYWRPWVVEFDVPEDAGKSYGKEFFVPATAFDAVQLVRVMPLDGYCREEYGDYGWTETWSGKTFDTNEPIDERARSPFRGWTCPDARGADPAWLAAYEQRVAAFAAQRGRGALESASQASPFLQLFEAAGWGSLRTRYGTGFVNEWGTYVDVGGMISHDEKVAENPEVFGLTAEEVRCDYPTDMALTNGWLRLARGGSTLYVGDDEGPYSVGDWYGSFIEIMRAIPEIEDVYHDKKCVLTRAEVGG